MLAHPLVALPMYYYVETLATSLPLMLAMANLRGSCAKMKELQF
jgi:hypothetical protein